MRVCKECLYTEEHPFGITFDEGGVCSGCQVHSEKEELDWSERGEVLQKIAGEYKSKTSQSYDCIVPVSGGDNSFFVLDYIKSVLKLNPLIVSYNKHYNSKVGIKNVKRLREAVGADIITQTIDPEVVKSITRATLREFGSMYWHCIAGQTVFPVQLAVSMKIPLIIWGLHQGCDQVGMFSHTDEVEMTRKYRKEHDLMGYEAEDLALLCSELEMEDLSPFSYPHSRSIEAVGVKGIYLSNYIRWDSKAQHEKSIGKYGYSSEFPRRSFDSYNHIDCAHYLGVHDYLKLLKCGYSKVTDHACREIRFGRISRDEASSLVLSYQTRPIADLSYFLNWVGMENGEFGEIVEKHRNTKFWVEDESGWALRKDYLGNNNSELVRSAERKLSFLGTEIYPHPSHQLLTRGYSF